MVKVSLSKIENNFRKLHIIRTLIEIHNFLTMGGFYHIMPPLFYDFAKFWLTLHPLYSIKFFKTNVQQKVITDKGTADPLCLS